MRKKEGYITLKKKKFVPLLAWAFILASCSHEQISNINIPGVTGSPVVDTSQDRYYDDRDEISPPGEGTAFSGQDAQYSNNVPDLSDNGDGTVTDNMTGLMWTKSADTDGNGSIDADDKMSFDEAVSSAGDLTLAGYTDWRLPTIKELYSLMDFRGLDPSGYEGTDTSGLIPFINTNYFMFGYGDPAVGERIIDAQFVSSTLYTSTTMNGNKTVFGVNFADGRIKGYPAGMMPDGNTKHFYVLYVRGNTGYGKNEFSDNGDGTITDNASGLMWMQDDSGVGMNWREALEYAEDLEFGGYSDWRLPNSKELQSLVDYSRSPDTAGTAAIDPLFHCTPIINEAGQVDYPWYWSGTTHANHSPNPGGYAAYVCFGRAMGYMFGSWIDVHGAGAQRSDPKSGDPGNYPFGHGPQGDAIRITNYVRCVRTAGQ